MTMKTGEIEMRFTLMNNAGEEIERYNHVMVAKQAADKRTDQLCGARHYVWDGALKFICYDTHDFREASE